MGSDGVAGWFRWLRFGLLMYTVEWGFRVANQLEFGHFNYFQCKIKPKTTNSLGRKPIVCGDRQRIGTSIQQ